MGERTSDLVRLREHLVAAEQLADRLGLVYEWRTFPGRVLVGIVGDMVPEPARSVATELIAEPVKPDGDTRRIEIHPTPSSEASPLTDPVAHPTPDQT